MEEELSSAFATLRPICVRLTKEHSRENVATLHSAIKQITTPAAIQQLQEYIIFPLRIILKQPVYK